MENPNPKQEPAVAADPEKKALKDAHKKEREEEKKKKTEAFAKKQEERKKKEEVVFLAASSIVFQSIDVSIRRIRRRRNLLV